MEINIQTQCRENNASNWVIAGMNRRFVSREDFEARIDVICLEIAQELDMTFEKKDDIFCFKDK